MTEDKRERKNEAAKRYRDKNKEAILASAREYYAKNSELIRQKTSAYYYKNNDSAICKAKSYRELNAERISIAKSDYYQSHKSEARARSSLWESNNPEKVAEMARNKRARRRGAEGKHTASEIRAIFESQKGLCANCKTKLFKSGAKKYHADHIMPLAKGGSNFAVNIQCLCPSCNLRKGAKHPDDWAKENGRLL